MDKKTMTIDHLEKKGELIDTIEGNAGLVRLFRLRNTYITAFPDGQVEYHPTAEGWRDEMTWRYSGRRAA